jgi:two-component system response regulator AtoC
MRKFLASKGNLMGGRPTVVIIGEQEGVDHSIRRLGFQPVLAGQPEEALPPVQGLTPSLVLINLPGRVVDPRFLRKLSKEGPVLILTDPDGSSMPVRPKNGKIRVLVRPIAEADLQAALRMAVPNGDGASAAPENRYLAEYAPFFDQSPAMRAIRGIIEQVANTNATVLIRGESGVGKDLVARAIHYASPRYDKPFVKVNCAALPAELLESELFGHEKGAFTGAYRRKLGKFEFANKGTLFLDEIGELPLALQAKLLHVLQDQEFSRLGGREAIRVDTRVLASTNRNLEAALAAGQFREDLYYRLNVVEIQVPPLRDRREEIPGLITYFLDKFQRQYGRKATFPPDLLRAFTEYPWPGNIRELENMVRRLVVLGNAPQIQEELLARLQARPAKPPGAPAPGTPHAALGQPDSSTGLREIARRAAREAERRAIQEVLDRVRWNRTKAARLLKISYKTLLSKIAECGLAPKESTSESYNDNVRLTTTKRQDDMKGRQEL